MQGEALLIATKRPSQVEKGVSFNSKILLPLFLFSITLQANGSLHAPLHSERGRGLLLSLRIGLGGVLTTSRRRTGR